MNINQQRRCICCNTLILESMGSVIARDILHDKPVPVRELCGKCVGKLCYANDTITFDLCAVT